MQSLKHIDFQLNLENTAYSHCCTEKFGQTKKWMKDDFNLKDVDLSSISVFNKVKLNKLEGSPFGTLSPDDKPEKEQFTLFIDGRFFKMEKYTVSSKFLKGGDLIHYVITAEKQLKLKRETRFDDVLESLSDREKEVLTFFAQGLSMTRIAKILFLSPHTIDSHRMNLCKKLKVKRTTELAVWAHKLGLLKDKASASIAS